MYIFSVMAVAHVGQKLNWPTRFAYRMEGVFHVISHAVTRYVNVVVLYLWLRQSLKIITTEERPLLKYFAPPTEIHTCIDPDADYENRFQRNHSNNMKRKLSLIETYDVCGVLEENSICAGLFTNKLLITDSRNPIIMYKNSIWFKSLVHAEKTCLKEDKIKKIHYKFGDGKEMVEEYNVDTQVLLRRAWKTKGKLGGEGKWSVEIGDPIPETNLNADSLDIIESKDQPALLKRNTRINMEWRIRNLPYPIETYSIKANNEDKLIIISTTNKKYYKKLEVPELTRLGLAVEQGSIQATHKYNTLIITYKKPQQMLDMEKEWYEELNKVKATTDIPNDCKTQ